MPTLEALEAELRQVEKKLADAEAQLPAHSVRPGQMEAVFELEEKRDALAAEIQKLRHPSDP